MDILNEKTIFLNVDITEMKDVLLFICKEAAKQKIISEGSEQEVLESFINRENESTTGFEDGFAIPHAVSKSIVKPMVLFVRLKKGIEWKSLDNNPTKYIIALFIPFNQRTSSHMNVLSSIAVGLMNEDFKNILKKSVDMEQILHTFKFQIDNKKEVIAPTNENNFEILVITACPVGIAHTYLAAESIEKALIGLDIKGKVSTHGSVGIVNDFTDKEIKEAKLIIIASDIGIDISRFKEKRIYQTNIKLAISNPVKLVQNALEKAKIINSEPNSNENEPRSEMKKSYIVKHLLSGVSYMIPFIIFGGLLIALSLGLGKAIYTDGNIPDNTFLFYLLKFGEVAFGLMIAILGGYIANSIAGRSAIAPAMIVSLIANNTSLIFPLPGIELVQTPLGFIGAILFGILIGYTVKWMNSWKIHRNLSSLMPIFIIPLGVTIFYALLSVFIIGAPIGFIMDKFGEAMGQVFKNNETSNIGVRVGVGIGMGLLIGMMAGFDMGGPINKIAFVMSAALLATDIQNPMGMMAAAIPVAPIAMGISTLVYRKNFTKEQKSLGISAIMMGTIGISEGAIPFAIADPKRVFIANIAGSAVAGAIAGATGVTGAVAHGGPIVALLGGISGNFIGGDQIMQTVWGIVFFFTAIIIGIIVTVFVYGLLLKYVKNSDQNKIEKQNMFYKFKLKTKTLLTPMLSISILKNNRKVIALSFMSIMTTILIIAGISLLITSSLNGELSNFIDGINNNDLIEKPIFPINIMYGLFCQITGI
ncbi:MAG: fructose-specific PTS transporter subunit EIIC, partial [Mycoplasmataceae bacterium]|nr:fructose-specific PTS transporter subunit EIIC [Mycoplasmataceae bacterium]